MKENKLLEKLPYFVNAFGKIMMDSYSLSYMTEIELLSLLNRCKRLREELFELIPYEILIKNKEEIYKAYSKINDLIWLKSKEIEDELEEKTND